MKWLTALSLVVAVTLTAARTATRQPGVTAQITSLNDKDAKRKAMEHPAFANAGTTPGTEIWRIENFVPVPVPQSDYGKFYKGDSYIVLKTKADKRNNLSWDIHYWLGAESSQDEAGAAAILSVGLDDKFNGAPVQHREVQGHESSQFMSYFQPAIRYLDGGHASGFNHVTTNAGAEKRLFQIKGKRNVRVRQVDPLISSMNKGDVFILDKDQNILVYVGERAKNVEKLKAISVANQIRDQDHNGRGRVEIIDSYSRDADVEKFFTALGSGSRDLVPDDSAGGDDQTFERNEEQTITLSEISDKSGKLTITPLPKPYRQEQLNPQEAYILDTVSGSIYVWVGKQATAREKSEAMSKAQEYLKSKNYPSWVHVGRIPQGTEPAAFKQYFATWRDVGMAHSRLVRSASDEEFYGSDEEKSENRASAIARSGTAREFMPDGGEGDFVVYIIDNMSLRKIYDSSNHGTEPGMRFGEFYQGDSYVIEYNYHADGSSGHVVYFWLGNDSSLDEKAGAAINAVLIDTRLNGKATIVRVPQGEEPKHFLKIFKGRLVTLLGGKASGFKNKNEKDTFDDDGVRLFRVHGTASGVDVRIEQVPEITSSLQSDDVFLLQTPQKVYVWIGQNSNAAELEEATQQAASLAYNSDVVNVKQGEEPNQFWTYLDGDRSSVKPAGQWRDALARRVGVEPKMFETTRYEKGQESFEEVHHFSQTDMDQEDIYLIDIGDVLYVWIGKNADKYKRTSIDSLASRYLMQLHQQKPVIFVKQGLEPEKFTEMFHEWHPDNWQKHERSYYDQKKLEALQLNEI